MLCFIYNSRSGRIVNNSVFFVALHHHIVCSCITVSEMNTHYTVIKSDIIPQAKPSKIQVSHFINPLIFRCIQNLRPLAERGQSVTNHYEQTHQWSFCPFYIISRLYLSYLKSLPFLYLIFIPDAVFITAYPSHFPKKEYPPTGEFKSASSQISLSSYLLIPPKLISS